MSNNTATRIPAFDVAKCLAIYLVIYGHTIQHYSTLDRLDNWAYLFVYSFHMPLFMVISGYFSISSYKMDFLPFIKKKFKQLLIPVLTFALIMTLWFALLEHRFAMSPIDYLLSYVTQLNTWLWFLRSLAICYILAYIGENMHIYRRLFYATVICLLLFTNYCNLAIMFPCFIFGIWMRKANFADNEMDIKSLLLPLLIFVTLIAFFNKNIWSAPSLNDLSNLSTFLFVKAYRIVMGISGATFIILSMRRLTDIFRSKKIYRAFSYIGQKTLAIYVIQCLVVEIAGPILIHPFAQNIDNQTTFNLTLFPILAFMFLCVCLLIIHILSKSKVAKLLLFGQ